VRRPRRPAAALASADWLSLKGAGARLNPCTPTPLVAPPLAHPSSTQGSSTGGLTGQANCDFVAPGYYWENGMAVACPVDTFSAEARPKAEATSCDAWCAGECERGEGALAYAVSGPVTRQRRHCTRSESDAQWRQAPTAHCPAPVPALARVHARHSSAGRVAVGQAAPISRACSKPGSHDPPRPTPRSIPPPPTTAQRAFPLMAGPHPPAVATSCRATTAAAAVPCPALWTPRWPT
jgi:hypothetical protein